MVASVATICPILSFLDYAYVLTAGAPPGINAADSVGRRTELSR